MWYIFISQFHVFPSPQSQQQRNIKNLEDSFFIRRQPQITIESLASAAVAGAFNISSLSVARAMEYKSWRMPMTGRGRRYQFPRATKMALNEIKK